MQARGRAEGEEGRDSSNRFPDEYGARSKDPEIMTQARIKIRTLS